MILALHHTQNRTATKMSPNYDIELSLVTHAVDDLFVVAHNRVMTAATINASHFRHE